jgi:chromosome segregation protein
MHLKSITLKGFKSFPDRTRLDFGRGVSVVVGPNGSGKSNITDGVLWALGEQSPLAVRGQSMQDLIFAGGHGVKGRNAAEVEVVIDNSDGKLASEFSEIAITRSLDRSGEGVYRLNGARCRLIDVVEVLSDTGLGKEMHSVISQGKVEQIVVSKPSDRTAMIEEAAGLSKHRKRRHRAQLKLDRTQDNLARALDVEREARSRLRPLKRQAEAAELHARLERQSLELRAELTAEALRAVRAELAAAEQAAGGARSERERFEAELMETAKRRERVEGSFAEHGQARERLSDQVFATRSAAERISIRLDSARERSAAVISRLERSARGLAAFTDERSGDSDGQAGGRLAELERELERLDAERSERLGAELAETDSERQTAEREAGELERRSETLTRELEQVDRVSTEAREQRRAGAERLAELEREQARLEVELSKIEQRLSLAGSEQAGPTLANAVEVDPRLERALAGALGGRLNAVLVADIGEGERTLERGAQDGVRALVRAGASKAQPSPPPSAGAKRLLDQLEIDPDARELVEALLADAWVVDRLADVSSDFSGIAVTESGAVFNGTLRELWKMPSTATGLGERAKRAGAESAVAENRRQLAQRAADVERLALRLREADARRDSIEVELRELRRRREQTLETARRAAWLIEQRRQHGSAPQDTRRAELSGEINAERRLVERIEGELREREQQRERLTALIAHDESLAPHARGAIAALEGALAAVSARRDELERKLSADEAIGQQVATQLRELAQREYELQARLRDASEALTQQEVRVAQIRDREQADAAELTRIAEALGVELAAAEQQLAEEQRAEIDAKLERIERRRERIGPVNPLAEDEYRGAIAHVEELEEQRKDLDSAISELQGLIRDTDRRIREAFDETFEAAARNFEEVIEQLFPGGRGRLRRINAPQPRMVLGGEQTDEGEAEGDGGESGAEAEAASEGAPANSSPGVEIEVTPAGKVPKRLSLLSGGEKSLVALGFMFAVFLARPCPFYILDEVEAALDDSNIDRFLDLVRRFADRAQFIVITHQRRTMEAADVIYGVSMASDGVSKVVSRKMEQDPPAGRDKLAEVAA